MSTSPPSVSNAASARIWAWRQARREAGLVKMEIWAPEAAREDIKAAVRAILTLSLIHI